MSEVTIVSVMVLVGLFMAIGGYVVDRIGDMLKRKRRDERAGRTR